MGNRNYIKLFCCISLKVSFKRKALDAWGTFNSITFFIAWAIKHIIVFSCFFVGLITFKISCKFNSKRHYHFIYKERIFLIWYVDYYFSRFSHISRTKFFPLEHSHFFRKYLNSYNFNYISLIFHLILSYYSLIKWSIFL